MKYCARYSNKIKMDNFDEIRIYYDNQDKELLNFLEQHADKRITLVIRDIDKYFDDIGWRLINAIHAQYPQYNLRVCFGEYRVFEPVSANLKICMEKLKVPYYTGYLVTNFEQLNHLCECGVSDVYIGEEICFDLARVSRVCMRYKVETRTFPNVGQASIKSTPALKKFFIRPEDVEVYEDYIDILEFWGPEDRQETLRGIYEKREWFGDLRDLILDFNLSFDSRCIMPGFAIARKNCERKCMKGGACTICDRVLSISEKLKDQGLIIKHPKKH